MHVMIVLVEQSVIHYGCYIDKNTIKSLVVQQFSTNVYLFITRLKHRMAILVAATRCFV